MMTAVSHRKMGYLSYGLLHQRASSGSRKGSGRAGSANMPGSASSRNNSAGSGE